jgi:hypothetical protein
MRAKNEIILGVRSVEETAHVDVHLMAPEEV